MSCLILCQLAIVWQLMYTGNVNWREIMVKSKKSRSADTGCKQCMPPRPSISLVLNAIALAMGVAVVILAITSNIDIQSSIVMLGVGVFCLGVGNLIRCDQC